MTKYSKIKVNVPDINRSYVNGATYKYSSGNVIQQNKKTIESVRVNLSEIISKWGTEFEVDNDIIVGFICTESTGKNAPKNAYNAIGYMQATPISVYETITKWNDKVNIPLSFQTKSLLAKHVPSYTKWKRDVFEVGDSNSDALVKALKDPEFNIAMGTAVIRWLLEAFKEGSESPLNKVMVAYNRGYSSSKNILKGSIDSEKMLKLKIGIEPKSYLLKMLGRYGFLDLMFGQ